MEGNYSKKVWIITIVLAICSIGMDIFFLTRENAFMKETCWITLPVAAYILYKGIIGLKSKIEEEKEEE